MAFGDADLTMMLGDVFSVPVVYAAQTCRGIFTTRDGTAVDADGVAVQVRETFVDVPADALTGLAEDAAITVDGTTYRVRTFGPAEDGRVVRVHLAKA